MRAPRTLALSALTLIASALPSALSARDFQYTYEGQTVNYTVIDEDAKTVRTKAGSSIQSGNNVSGDLVIPAKVNDIYGKHGNGSELVSEIL